MRGASPYLVTPLPLTEHAMFSLETDLETQTSNASHNEEHPVINPPHTLTILTYYFLIYNSSTPAVPRHFNAWPCIYVPSASFSPFCPVDPLTHQQRHIQSSLQGWAWQFLDASEVLFRFWVVYGEHDGI